MTNSDFYFSSVRKKFSPFRVERLPKKSSEKIIKYPVYEEEVEWREMENLWVLGNPEGSSKLRRINIH